MQKKIVQPTKLKSLVIVILLALLGYTANYLNLPIAYSVAFIFGSIFSIIALCSLGIGFGLIVAFLGSVYTYYLWNHPYAIIIFTLEILWIGLALKRGKRNLILIDSVYWLVLGAPLIALFYYGFMHLGVQSATIIWLKQSLNGILNALIASIILTHTPVSGWIRGQQIKKKSSYALSIFHMVSVFLIGPTLIIVLAQNYQNISSTQQRVVQQLLADATETESVIADWVSIHVNAVRVIAELGARYTLQPSGKLQEELQQIHTLFPDFHNIFLGDSNATTVAFYPPVNEQGESTIGINFIDREWFKQLSRTLKPVISGIFLGRGGIFVPIFTISVPIVIEGRFSHFGLGAVNLEKMRALFERLGSRSYIIHTIIDRNSNVVISSDLSRKPLTQLIEPSDGQNIPISSEIFLRVPGTQKNISIMDIWKDASYITRLPIRGTSWTLLVEYPVGPLQENLYDTAIKSLGSIALIYIAMIVLATFLSNLLTRPIEYLSQVSKDIPLKIDQGEKIIWPESDISEVSELINNFTITAQTLENRLLETRERYKVLVDISPSGIWTTDNIGKTTYVSSKWCKITGIQPKNAMGIGWLKAIHPDDQENVHTTWSASIANGSTFQSEYRLKMPDGNIKWVWDLASIVREHGSVSGWVGTITDITTQKKAEQALRESKENFQNFFNTIDNFLFILDEQGRILLVNQTVINRLGYELDELKNQPILFVHPEKRGEEAGQIVADMLQGSRESCPVPLITKEGQLIPVETYVTMGTWNGKKAIFGISKDISALKESEEKFAKVFQNNPMISGLSDLETGEYIEVNQTFYDITGFSPEEVIGKPATEVVRLDYQFREETLKKLTDHGQIRNEEAVIYTKKGIPIHVLISAEVIKLQNKQYNYTTALDITKLKQTEESLRKLSRAVEQSPTSVVITDLAGKIEYVNPSFEKLTGYTQEEALGENPRVLKSGAHADEFYKELWDKITGGQVWRGILQNRKKNGDFYWESTIIAPVKNNMGDVINFVAVKEDITERKRTEEQIKRNLKEKETLLQEIHHRVKNNLAIVSSLLGLQANSVKTKESKDALIESQNRIQSIAAIHETLYQSENLSHINLNTYLSTIAKEISESYMTDKQVKVTVETGDILIGIKKASPLGLIVNELITNSFKHAFTEIQNPIINISLHKSTGDQMEMVYLDNGIGMRKDFDWQNAETMGLKLIKILGEGQLDGSIEMKRDQGTCFIFRFNLNDTSPGRTS